MARAAKSESSGAYLGYDAAGRLLFTSGASFTYFDYDGDKMIHERANGGSRITPRGAITLKFIVYPLAM